MKESFPPKPGATAPGRPAPRAPRRRGRLGPTLVRLVAGALLAPVAIAALGLVAAALTKNVLGWVDLVVNRGLGAEAVAAIALYQAAPVAAWTLPVALLLGMLVGLGRLRADAELLAIELAGVHPFRLLVPVLLVALPLAACEAGLTTTVAPAARRGLLAAFDRLAAAHPTATLRAGAPRRFGDRELLAREVSADGRRLRGVLLWMPDEGETVFAERARVEALGSGRARIEMEDVVVLSAPGEDTTLVRTGRFHSELSRDPERPFETPLDLHEAARWHELRAQAAGAADPAERRLARAALQRRLALPASIPVLAVLALPLALGARGGSAARGAATGMAALVAYYALVQLGNGLLQQPAVPVAGAVWMPVGVAALAAGALLVRRRGGGGIPRPQPRRRARAASRRGRGARRRPLDRYVLGLHTGLVLLSLAGLATAYLAVDVMERLEWLARHGATFGEAVHFYSARIVLLVSRVVPMALLAGTAVLVGVVDARGELLAMRSLGIRPARALAPVLVASLLWAPLYFAFEERVVPSANARADRIKEAEIKDGRGDEVGSELWHRQGDRLVHARRASPQDDVLRALTVYRIGPDGLPTARIDAPLARHLGGGRWQLTDGREVRISPTGVGPARPRDTLRLATEGGLRDTMHMGAFALAREIRRAEADGYDTTAYRVDWHRKLAAPAACVLLPALALLQALGARERRSIAGGIVVSVVLGIGYLLAQDAATALAYGGRIPPAAAGWGPPALLAALAAVLALRARG